MANVITYILVRNKYCTVITVHIHIYTYTYAYVECCNVCVKVHMFIYMYAHDFSTDYHNEIKETLDVKNKN